jgi:hypothetical protein
MRYAVEYQLPSGRMGLCLFAATGQEAAEKYVEDMTSKYGYCATFNLKEVPMGAGMNELYQMYPDMNKRMREEYKRRVVISEGQG